MGSFPGPIMIAIKYIQAYNVHWRQEMKHEKEYNQALLVARNDLAVILSIIPGLGHLYKGYYLNGLCLFLLAPLMVFVGLVISLATLGAGLLLPVVYWIAVAVSAYHMKDHRKHHLIHF
jgi:TM2 domain-containing membrane protein YozV